MYYLLALIEMLLSKTSILKVKQGNFLYTQYICSNLVVNFDIP